MSSMRVSTTTLESFRLWSDPEQQWMPEEELIATIKGTLVQTPKMLLGQAFGRCLEKPRKYHRDGVYCVPVRVGERWVEYLFTEDLMAPCLKKFDPDGVFEAKATKEYGDIVVVSKADQLIGSRIIENKAKTSQFDFDKYADSYQWRFELDIFEGATSLTYNIFLLNEDDHGEITLRGIETFNVFPYAELHQDCCNLIQEFVEYVRARGLDEGLRERQRAWA